MRTQKYTKFDRLTDFMFAVNYKREKEINLKLSQSGAIRRDDLLTEKLLCRFQISPESFSCEMEACSEAACDRIYGELNSLDETSLNDLQREVNKTAWQLHVNRGCPRWLATMFSEYLPANADDRSVFLRDIAVIYFAIMQKYIFIRKSEISNNLKTKF